MKKKVTALFAAAALLLFTGASLSVYADDGGEDQSQPVLSAGSDSRLLLDDDGKILSDGDQSLIAKQPENAEVNYPAGTQFHIEMKDPSQVASYQWVASDGYNIFELTGASAHTDTLIIPATSQDDPEMGYVCVIQTKDGKQIISEPASMNVVNPLNDQTVLYVGEFAVQPGDTFDLSSTPYGSGTIRFDANGSDITLENLQFDNTEAVYDHTLSPGIGFFLVRRRPDQLEYNFHFKGDCSILNTFFQPEHNAGGVAFNAFFGTGEGDTHPAINIDSEGSLKISGGSNLIYTDAEVVLNSDITLSSYGDYFSDGIRCHNLYVEKGVNVQLDVHGTAIHTLGDIYLYEGSKVDISSAPARVAVGATAKDIIWLGGALHATGAQLNIKGYGDPEAFVPYGSYLMMLNGIAMNGSGAVYFDNTEVHIDLSTGESDVLFAGNFTGITGDGVNSAIDLTNESVVDIQVHMPGAISATGISPGGIVNVEKGSSLIIDVSGDGETFGMALERTLTLNDGIIDVNVVSNTQEATYGVVCEAAEIKLSDSKYKFRSYAKEGVALAANTGEITDEAETYDSKDYEPTQIILGGKARYMTPKKAKVGLFSIPGYGAFIKAEAVTDQSAAAPAEEVMISVNKPSMIPWMIVAVLAGLALGFVNGQNKKTK